MSKRKNKHNLCSYYLVIYSSSVEGGYSWALTNTDDKELIKGICKQLRREVGETFCLCTLQGLISFKSGSRVINNHWREFVTSIVNDEYEQFENLKAVDLRAERLLESNNQSLLYDLLQEFFNTGYTSDFDRFLVKHGVSVMVQSEG